MPACHSELERASLSGGLGWYVLDKNMKKYPNDFIPSVVIQFFVFTVVFGIWLFKGQNLSEIRHWFADLPHLLRTPNLLCPCFSHPFWEISSQWCPRMLPVDIFMFQMPGTQDVIQQLFILKMFTIFVQGLSDRYDRAIVRCSGSSVLYWWNLFTRGLYWSEAQSNVLMSQKFQESQRSPRSPNLYLVPRRFFHYGCPALQRAFCLHRLHQSSQACSFAKFRMNVK